jgi:hypothetical protein
MWDDIISQLNNKEEAYLAIKVIPGSSRTEFREIMADGTYKIAIAAAPEKGKANTELVKFLAKEFGVLKSRLVIISGAGERTKLVKITK